MRTTRRQIRKPRSDTAQAIHREGEPILTSQSADNTHRPYHESPAIETLEDVLDHLQAADLDGDGAVSIREIFDVFGTRSFGPVLLILGLIQALPTGGIPLMPDVVGVLAILLFVQMLIRPQRPWLPERLLRVTIPQSLLDRSIARVRPWIRRADGLFRARMCFLLDNRPALATVAASGVVTGILIILLGFVPFAAALPALALICIGIGLTAEDGVSLLLGYAIILGSVGFGVYLFGLL